MSGSLKTAVEKIPIVFQAALVIVACALIGWILLALVYCIPSSCMADNALKSSAALQAEGLYPDLRHSNGISYDNFTDARMLNEALYSSGNPLIDSLATREFHNGSNHIEFLTNAAQEIKTTGSYNGDTIIYGRYWHGYLFYLKPLLCIMDVYGMRQLFGIIFACLLALLASEVVRFRKRVPLLVGLFFSLGLFSVFEASQCLAFFPSMIIPLIGSYAVLRAKKLTPKTTAFIFVALGTAIAYFDYLDNPILTWGIPATFVIYRLSEEGASTKQQIQTILVSMFAWGLSYALMWLMKLVLATLFTSYNALVDALNQAKIRVGADDSNSDSFLESAIMAIIKNAQIDGFAQFAIRVLYFASVIGLIAKMLICKNERSFVLPMIILLLISITPYLWFGILSNHSTIHAWFTYRNQLLTCFALTTAICLLMPSPNRQKKLELKNLETI